VEPDFRELEAALSHGFSDHELLARALTHRSLAKEMAQAAGAAGERSLAGAGDNERLEFLGDAVLNLVVAEILFALHPEWGEGELTRVRAQLVSRSHMASVASAVGVGKFLRLSRHEERSGLRHKSSVLSDAMEAVMGALFLDGGLEPARAFVRRQVIGQAVEHLAAELRLGAALGNYKSALQERLQAARSGSPVYGVKRESGPAHRKRFLIEVRLKNETGQPGKLLARGLGASKKLAEQDAARRALESLPTADAASAVGIELNKRVELKREEPAAT
jgi:ribonuclease III